MHSTSWKRLPLWKNIITGHTCTCNMALVEHRASSSNVNKQNVHTSSEYDLPVHLQAVPEEEVAFAASRQPTMLSVGTRGKFRTLSRYMDSLVSHQELVAAARRTATTNLSTVLHQRQERERWHANRIGEHT